MIANASARSHEAVYSRKFKRVVQIDDPSKYRPGFRLPEEEKLGGLAIHPSGETTIEITLPFAYYEMRQLHDQCKLALFDLKIHGAKVLVITDEDTRLPMFERWLSSEEGAAESKLIGPAGLGLWAIDFQLAWAYTETNAQLIRSQAFH